MAPLAICWRSNLPALFQRLADLGLRELLLPGKIFAGIAWLTVFRNELRRPNVLRFPIEIEDLIVRPQIIFRMPMAVQAPRHAFRLASNRDALQYPSSLIRRRQPQNGDDALEIVRSVVLDLDSPPLV